MHQPGAQPEAQKHETKSVLTRAEGYEPVRMAIAGVAHQDRRRHVRGLALGEIVRLCRDSRNEFDPNAVSVETSAGRHLGYIGRTVAATLSPYMETLREPLEAAVTELTSDVSGEAVGAAISFYLPKQLVADIIGHTHEWDFRCETNPDGGTYLMLDCDEAELTRVTEALQGSGFPWLRSGLSYGSAADGRQYRWYVRLESEPASQILAQLLNDTLGAGRRRSDVTEWIAEFAPENVRLLSQNEALSTHNTTLRVENARLMARCEELEQTLALLRQRHGSRRRELSGVIDSVLPGVLLLRDSLDVIERELKSPELVLRELRVLCWEPSTIRAERVQSAPEWREKHFSTGQKDDGRLYFRQRDRSWTVLVSFKRCQDRDIEYLRRC